jgi:hypothetical protein
MVLTPARVGNVLLDRLTLAAGASTRFESLPKFGRTLAFHRTRACRRSIAERELILPIFSAARAD